MIKKALLIEINYIDTKYETKSEVNIEDVGLVLEKKYSYNNIIYLREKNNNTPTKENILNNIYNSINELKETDEMIIFFMGHSTTIIDEKNEHIQRGLVPIDYKNNGYIHDDEIKKIIELFKCKLMIIFDCVYGNNGFNIDYSLRLVEGKFIHDNNHDKYNSNQSKKKYIMSISPIRPILRSENESYKEQCNLITRRIIESLCCANYTIEIDRFLKLIFYKLLNESYYIQAFVLSSNCKINGQENIFVSNGSNYKLNISYNYFHKNEEIVEKKENKQSFNNKIESIEVKPKINTPNLTKNSPLTINKQVKQSALEIKNSSSNIINQQGKQSALEVKKNQGPTIIQKSKINK
jgi:hypothetical protein